MKRNNVHTYTQYHKISAAQSQIAKRKQFIVIITRTYSECITTHNNIHTAAVYIYIFPLVCIAHTERERHIHTFKCTHKTKYTRTFASCAALLLMLLLLFFVASFSVYSAATLALNELFERICVVFARCIFTFW